MLTNVLYSPPMFVLHEIWSYTVMRLINATCYPLGMAWSVVNDAYELPSVQREEKSKSGG